MGGVREDPQERRKAEDFETVIGHGAGVRFPLATIANWTAWRGVILQVDCRAPGAGGFESLTGRRLIFNNQRKEYTWEEK